MILRLFKLYIGLILFGLGLALMLEGDLGLGPWEVLHQGLSKQYAASVSVFGWEIDLSSVGMVSIFISVLVLVFWIPLRERPGFGTIMNFLVIGSTIDVGMALLPNPDLLILKFTMMFLGPVSVALGTIIYIGARMGAGPRDGLMTGLAKRGIPVSLGRTMIEVTVLICGFLLGGSVGLGTVWFAFGIGPLIQLIGRYGPFDDSVLSHK